MTRKTMDASDELRDEFIAKMAKALTDAGIKVEINGCGCCGSPWIKFEEGGHTYLADNAFLDTLQEQDDPDEFGRMKT